MGNASIVSSGFQPIVTTELLIELGQPLMMTPSIPIGSTQTIGSMLTGHTTTGKAGIL